METICIFTGRNHQEALNVKEILESNDIPTLMPNEHVSGLFPHYSLATGGYSIFISKNEFMKAAELLNSLNIDIQNSNLVDNLERIKKEKELEVCPACGNQSLETIIENSPGLIMALFLFFGIPVNAKKSRKVCHICGSSAKS